MTAIKRLAGATMTLALAVFSAPGPAYDANDWPTHYTFRDGDEIGVIGNLRYELAAFSNDTLPDGSSRFADSQGIRRKELGIALKKRVSTRRWSITSFNGRYGST